jgi:heme/copper-type cytochrome/quinol oxidase subunit 1
LVQHSLGLEGMPRRVYTWHAEDWAPYNLISSIGSFILALGVLTTLVNVVLSFRRGKRAGNDPWHANTLEWLVPSPPPPNNFDVIPTVRSLTPMQNIRRDVASRTKTGRETVANPSGPAL